MLIFCENHTGKCVTYVSQTTFPENTFTSDTRVLPLFTRSYTKKINQLNQTTIVILNYKKHTAFGKQSINYHSERTPSGHHQILTGRSDSIADLNFFHLSATKETSPNFYR